MSTPQTEATKDGAATGLALATGSAIPAGRYICKDYSQERDYVCALSESDRRHGINSMGTLSAKNAYGELWWVDDKYPEGCVVICGHGGSMWLCLSCKDNILAQQNK